MAPKMGHKVEDRDIPEGYQHRIKNGELPTLFAGKNYNPKNRIGLDHHLQKLSSILSADLSNTNKTAWNQVRKY